MIALCAPGFAGCTQDDAPTVQEQEISVAARSTTDSESTTTEPFTDDFTLILWNANDATKQENHDMTYSETEGWNTVKTSLLPATAFAYKGKDVSVTSPTEYTVTLQADQSDAEKLYAADVMTATGSVSTDTPLSLNFEHEFSKITFKATFATEFDANTAVITAFTVKTTPEVSAYINGKEITAIIAPGTYTGGNEFVSLTVNDAETPLIVKVPTDGLTFVAGKHYTFTLKVGKDKVTLTQVTAGDLPEWNNDNEEDLN